MSDDVKALREKFEALPEIDNIFKHCTYRDLSKSEKDFVKGAWYAFQEQQQRITTVKSILGRIYAETEGDDELLMKYLDEIQEVLK